MGRLEDIIERNKHPGKTARKRRGIGMSFAMIVVFGALVLLIFTDLASPPDDKPAPAPTPTAKPDGQVRGLKLWSPKRGSGSGSAGSGSAH